MIDYHIKANKYSRLVFRQLLFRRLWNPILFILYLEFWQVSFSLAKYGNLGKNLLILAIVTILLLCFCIEFLYSWRRYVKSAIGESYRLEFLNKGIEVIDENSKVKTLFPWEDLVRVRERGKWYFLYFSNRRFLPILKSTIEARDIDEFRELLQSQKKVRQIRFSFIVILIWLIVTFAGVYSIGKSAVNFNGKLSWFIHDLRSNKTISLENDNIYEGAFHNLLQDLEEKHDFMDHLMPSSFSLTFEGDGSIRKLDAYLYGYDENYQLKEGYLIYYDSAKTDKLTLHVQDFQGDVSQQEEYNRNNDVNYLMDLLSIVPLQEDVSRWNAEEYSLLYKGYHSWGTIHKEFDWFMRMEGSLSLL